MAENPDDELLITLRVKRHQLWHRNDGTLYGLHDNIGSLIHIGGGNTTQIVGIEAAPEPKQLV